MQAATAAGDITDGSCSFQDAKVRTAIVRDIVAIVALFVARLDAIAANGGADAGVSLTIKARFKFAEAGAAVTVDSIAVIADLARGLRFDDTVAAEFGSDEFPEGNG